MDDCTPCAAASPLWRCDHLFAVSHVLDGHFRAAARQALFQPLLLPGPSAWKSYDTILRLTDFPTYYVNSIVVACSTTLLTILVATPMAYALVRSRLPGMMVIVRAMLFAYMFPALLLAIPIYLFLVKIGFDDSPFSLVLTYCSFTLPLGVWLMGSSRVFLLKSKRPRSWMAARAGKPSIG